jgi:hypothetical protein
VRRELVFDQSQTVAYDGQVMYFEFGQWLISVRAERIIDRKRRDKAMDNPYESPKCHEEQPADLSRDWRAKKREFPWRVIAIVTLSLLVLIAILSQFIIIL